MLNVLCSLFLTQFWVILGVFSLGTKTNNNNMLNPLDLNQCMLDVCTCIPHPKIVRDLNNNTIFILVGLLFLCTDWYSGSFQWTPHWDWERACMTRVKGPQPICIVANAMIYSRLGADTHKKQRQLSHSYRLCTGWRPKHGCQNTRSDRIQWLITVPPFTVLGGPLIA